MLVLLIPVGAMRAQNLLHRLAKDRLAFGGSFDAAEPESVPSIGGDPGRLRPGIGHQEGIAPMERT